MPIANNPVQRFVGIVNNYAVNETWSGQNASNTINLICRSAVGYLSQRTAGRRTNNTDENYYFPGDNSFSHVQGLLNTLIQFGP